MNDRMPLTDRLDAGPVICAEGFLFELERRGYLTAGEFVPEVALEYPDALRALHVDYPARGLRRRRGVHLQRAPREDAGHRQGRPARTAEPGGLADRPRGRRRAPGRPDGRQHLEQQHLGPRRSAASERGPGHVPGDGGLGRRGRRRSDHRRDLLLRRRGPRRPRGRQVERAAGGAHHCPDGAERDGRRRGDRGDLPTAGAGRRGRRRHELLPRTADHAAVAARDPSRRVLPRRCTPDPLPDDRRRADVLQPQRPRRERALSARAHVPDRAGPAVREPLRGRRLRPRGSRDSGSTTSACAVARHRC